MNIRPPGFSQSAARSSSRSQLRMCSNISTVTIRWNWSGASKWFMSAVVTSTLRRRRSAARRRMNSPCGAELETARKRQPGNRSAAQSVKEPQPHPRSSTRMPSATPARSAVSASIASSAAPKSATPAGQWPALYLSRGPRIRSKNAGGTS